MPTTIARPVHPRAPGWTGLLARAFRFWAKHHVEMMSYQRGRR